MRAGFVMTRPSVGSCYALGLVAEVGHADLAHCGCSFVLEVDPTTKENVWLYDQREQFHSNFTSSCQRLPNGNTFVLEAAHKRLFEVTPECEIVWEHVFAGPPFIQRAYRYGPGFCPQLDALLK